MVKYLYRGHEYSVEGCSKEEVPSHLERVLVYYEHTETGVKFQTKLLEKCIDNGTAWQIKDDEGNSVGQMYFMPHGKHEMNAHHLWFQNKRVFAMMAHYLMYHTNCETIFYMPHQRKVLPFKFLMSEDNAKRFYNSNDPLIIPIYTTANIKLVEKYFINEGIEEI